MTNTIVDVMSDAKKFRSESPWACRAASGEA